MVKAAEKASLIVGIPSFKEAATIGNVARQTDKGLRKYFKEKKAAIINADNNSPDKTKDAFLKAKTKTQKIYISTPPGTAGKGNNVKNALSEMIRLDAEAGMLIDADLKSVSPEWVKKLIKPVLRGCDFVTPVYHRKKTDGTITNNICYPLIYGLLDKDIRQPIGGEAGFSKKFANHCLEQNWQKEIRQYGVDIFLTMQAIRHGFKISKANLGEKIHNPSAPKLGPMFIQVTKTLFDQLLAGKKDWPKLVKRAKKKTGEIKPWTKTVYDSLCGYAAAESARERGKIIKNLWRHFEEKIKKPIGEKRVLEQAKNFYENRGYLLRKLRKQS